MTHLYKVKNKQGELVIFKPNEIQTKHIIERRSHTRGLILKARQFGFTTFYCIDYLDEALWHAGTTSAILGHERGALDEIFQIIKRAVSNLPEELKPKTNTDTQRMYRFTSRFDGLPLDSSIYVALKLRSGTVQNLHITESAHIKDRQELNAGSKQSVPKDGRITEETTANGMNEFFDAYTYYDNKQIPEDLDYKTYFYPWFINSEYSLEGQMPTILPEDKFIYGDENELKTLYSLTDGQLLWRRWKIRELRADSAQKMLGLSALQLFKQEYPASKKEAFQSGAGNVFDLELLDSYQTAKPITLETYPINKEHLRASFLSLYNKGVNIYRLPEFNEKYVIGVDPSDGVVGGDSGAIAVRPKQAKPDETIKQMAVFEGVLRPDELGDLSIEIANFYNHAFMGVENNMLTCILHVSKNYDNYYLTTTIDEKTKLPTKKIGWTTSGKTRDPMIDDYVKLFEEKEIEIVSDKVIGQMQTFIKHDDGRREHAVGKHDDVLFADFICVQMLKHDRPLARSFETRPF